MKRIRFRVLVSMGVIIMATSFFVCCSSDDFFGIESDSDGMNYSMLKKIAYSKEFIEYQKQIFISMEEFDNIDNTKTMLLSSDDEKPIYDAGINISIHNVLIARQQLIEAYPEYKEATYVEKNQIINLAILNNKALMRMANKYNYPQNMTKSSIPTQIYAFKFIQLVSLEKSVSPIESGEPAYLIDGSFNWYLRTWWYDAVLDAIQYSALSGLEIGGLIFRDQSGILTLDSNAENTRDYHEMSLCIVNIETNNNEFQQYTPVGDFHIHPSINNFTPSGADSTAWGIMSWSQHAIFDLEGHGEMYYY